MAVLTFNCFRRNENVQYDIYILMLFVQFTETGPPGEFGHRVSSRAVTELWHGLGRVLIL